MRKNKIAAIVAFLLLAALLVTACGRLVPQRQVPAEKHKETRPAGEEKPVEDGKEAKPEEAEVKLYFSDVQAQYLVPELRKVREKNLMKNALEELAKGPETEDLAGVIPPGTKVLGLESKGDTVYANFSAELVKRHPGGSAGETMTIYSVVDTLAQFPGVKKVVFLVEGKSIETISGHYDLTRAVEPRWDLVKN